MGCDIHFYVERLEDGRWVSADRWSPNKYKDDEGEPPVVLDYKDSYYHDRNYNLFGILADVRNGRGFAGCDTGDGFVPISEPRGLPTDASPEVRAEFDRWDSDGHSHSWLTVRELLDYDWTQVTKLRGWVDAVTYWKWVRFGRDRGENPAGWCGGVSGRDVKHISVEAMDRIAEQAQEIGRAKGFQAAEQWLSEHHGGTYTQAEWEQPYYKCASHFLSETLPRLWRLGKPEEVRCVFWFDN